MQSFSNSSGYLPDMDVLKINVNSIVTGVSSPWVALNEANNLNTQIKDGILVIRNIDDNINVRVYDVSGRVVLSTDKKVFSIHNLKPGTYFLKVTASGHNVVKQFIKQ